MSSGAEPEAPPVPAGWKAYWDGTHKRHYFHNESTNETTWETPQVDTKAPPAQGGGPAQYAPQERAREQPRQQQRQDRQYHQGHDQAEEQPGYGARDPRGYNDPRDGGRGGHYQDHEPAQRRRPYQQQQQQDNHQRGDRHRRDDGMDRPHHRGGHYDGGQPPGAVSRQSSYTNGASRGGDQGGDRSNAPPSDLGRKLYLSSLSWQTSRDDLIKEFGTVGPVEDAIVVYHRDQPTKSRGFGFVTMANKDDAYECMAKYDRREFKGRVINVEVSTQHSQYGSQADRSGRGRPGSNSYDNRAPPRDNRPPSPHDNRFDRGPPPGRGSQNLGGPELYKMVNECTIFVGQLNFRTNSMTLGKTFEALKIGPVVSAKVVYFPNEPGKSRGYGFVEFRDGASVQKAIDLMDGKDLDGRTVIVKPRSEGSGRPPTMYRRNNSGSFPNGVGSFHSSGPPPNRNGVGGGAPPARGNDRSRSPQPRRE